VPQPDNGQPTEAIVPIDFFTTNALILDTEFKEMFAATPNNVNLTAFFDSCHSGDIDRLLLAQNTSRSRFLHLTQAQIEGFNKFAQRRGLSLTASSAARGDQRDVTFAACRREESAFENNGQGDFTGRATALLRGSLSNVSNRDFYTKITGAFSNNARQHPQLLGGAGLFGLPFLEPLDGRSADATPQPNAQPAPASGAANKPLQTLAQGFRQLAEYLDQNAG
jgi:hypothetical protein